MESKEEMMKKTKMEKSSPFFRNTKVQSCNHVVVQGGKAVAVAYYQKKTGYKAPNSNVNKTKSSETASKSQYSIKDKLLTAQIFNRGLTCTQEWERNRCVDMTQILTETGFPNRILS